MTGLYAIPVVCLLYGTLLSLYCFYTYIEPVLQPRPCASPVLNYTPPALLAPTPTIAPPFQHMFLQSNVTTHAPSINTSALIDVDIVIFALSARSNFQLRNSTRNTWATFLPPRTILKFVVGQACLVSPKVRSRPKHNCETKTGEQPIDIHLQRDELAIDVRLALEQQLYGDILIVNVTDVYILLPDKLLTALHWGIQSTRAKFFMKTDDDVYLDIRNVLALDRGDPAHVAIIGNPHQFPSIPDRNPKAKWYQAIGGPRGWNLNYSEFPRGQCYFVTRRLAELVTQVRSHSISIQVKDNIRILQGEDVSMGMWNYIFGGTIIKHPKLMPECTGFVQHLFASDKQVQHHANFLKCGRPCTCAPIPPPRTKKPGAAKQPIVNTKPHPSPPRVGAVVSPPKSPPRSSPKQPTNRNNNPRPSPSRGSPPAVIKRPPSGLKPNPVKP